MKTLTLILTLFIFSNIYGQVPQIDNFTKLEILNAQTVRITNLQSCATTFKIKAPDSINFNLTTSLVQPGQFINVTYGPCGEIRVQPSRNCNEANTACTIVGANTCNYPLAVQGITTFEANRSGKGIEILLKLASENNVGRIEILTSTDRKNFVPALEFKPQGKLVYYLTFKN